MQWNVNESNIAAKIAVAVAHSVKRDWQTAGPWCDTMNFGGLDQTSQVHLWLGALKKQKRKLSILHESCCTFCVNKHKLNIRFTPNNNQHLWFLPCKTKEAWFTITRSVIRRYTWLESVKLYIINKWCSKQNWKINFLPEIKFTWSILFCPLSTFLIKELQKLQFRLWHCIINESTCKDFNKLKLGATESV